MGKTFELGAIGNNNSSIAYDVIKEFDTSLGIIQKSWTDDAIKIFLHEIPSWINLLPKAFRFHSGLQ